MQARRLEISSRGRASLSRFKRELRCLPVQLIVSPSTVLTFRDVTTIYRSARAGLA